MNFQGMPCIPNGGNIPPKQENIGLEDEKRGLPLKLKFYEVEGQLGKKSLKKFLLGGCHENGFRNTEIIWQGIAILPGNLFALNLRTYHVSSSAVILSST